MFVEFKRTLRKFRGNILGWGIGLAAYSLLMAFFGSSFFYLCPPRKATWMSISSIP